MLDVKLVRSLSQDMKISLGTTSFLKRSDGLGDSKPGFGPDETLRSSDLDSNIRCIRVTGFFAILKKHLSPSVDVYDRNHVNSILRLKVGVSAGV